MDYVILAGTGNNQVHQSSHSTQNDGIAALDAILSYWISERPRHPSFALYYRGIPQWTLIKKYPQN